MQIRQSGPDRTRLGSLTQGLGLCLAGLVFGGATLVQHPTGASWAIVGVGALMVLGGLRSLVSATRSRAAVVASGPVGLPATFAAGGSIPTRHAPRTGTTTDGRITVSLGVQPYRQVRFGGARLRVEPGRASITLRSWWYRVFPPSLLVGFEASTLTKVVPVTSLENSGGIWLQQGQDLAVLLWVHDRPHALAALAQAGFTISPEQRTPVAPRLTWTSVDLPTVLPSA